MSPYDSRGSYTKNRSIDRHGVSAFNLEPTTNKTQIRQAVQNGSSRRAQTQEAEQPQAPPAAPACELPRGSLELPWLDTGNRRPRQWSSRILLPCVPLEEVVGPAWRDLPPEALVFLLIKCTFLVLVLSLFLDSSSQHWFCLIWKRRLILTVGDMNMEKLKAFYGEDPFSNRRRLSFPGVAVLESKRPLLPLKSSFSASVNLLIGALVVSLFNNLFGVFGSFFSTLLFSFLFGMIGGLIFVFFRLFLVRTVPSYVAVLLPGTLQDCVETWDGWADESRPFASRAVSLCHRLVNAPKARRTTRLRYLIPGRSLSQGSGPFPLPGRPTQSNSTPKNEPRRPQKFKTSLSDSGKKTISKHTYQPFQMLLSDAR